MTCFKIQDLEKSSVTHLRLVVDPPQFSRFSLILQRGFMVRALVGCSVKRFLTEELGVSSDYIAERIQSVFLEGKPVDDLDSAVIHDGSHLSLSAAMPGLVGATLRRGGLYGALRGSITYKESGEQSEAAEGCLHLKLFNLLMKELAPHILQAGIYLNPSFFAEFLSSQPVEFWQGCKEILLNAQPVGRELFDKGNWVARCDLLCLSVMTIDGEA